MRFGLVFLLKKNTNKRKEEEIEEVGKKELKISENISAHGNDSVA